MCTLFANLYVLLTWGPHIHGLPWGPHICFILIWSDVVGWVYMTIVFDMTDWKIFIYSNSFCFVVDQLEEVFHLIQWYRLTLRVSQALTIDMFNSLFWAIPNLSRLHFFKVAWYEYENLHSVTCECIKFPYPLPRCASQLQICLIRKTVRQAFCPGDVKLVRDDRIIVNFVLSSDGVEWCRQSGTGVGDAGLVRRWRLVQTEWDWYRRSGTGTGENCLVRRCKVVQTVELGPARSVLSDGVEWDRSSGTGASVTGLFRVEECRLGAIRWCRDRYRQTV